MFGSHIKTAYASRAAIAAAVSRAHLVIGAVLVPGAAAPKLVTRDMLKSMKRGSVVVDIAIDQGGCFERSEEHTSELQSLMRISYAVFCLKKKIAEENTSILTTKTTITEMLSSQNHHD